MKRALKLISSTSLSLSMCRICYHGKTLISTLTFVHPLQSEVSLKLALPAYDDKNPESCRS